MRREVVEQVYRDDQHCQDHQCDDEARAETDALGAVVVLVSIAGFESYGFGSEESLAF